MIIVCLIPGLKPYKSVVDKGFQQSLIVVIYVNAPIQTAGRFRNRVKIQ